MCLIQQKGATIDDVLLYIERKTPGLGLRTAKSLLQPS